MRDDRNVQQSGPIGPRRIDDSAPDDDADDPAVSRLGAKHYSFDFTPRSTPPLPLARPLPPPPPRLPRHPPLVPSLVHDRSRVFRSEAEEDDAEPLPAEPRDPVRPPPVHPRDAPAHVHPDRPESGRTRPRTVRTPFEDTVSDTRLPLAVLVTQLTALEVAQREDVLVRDVLGVYVRTPAKRLRERDGVERSVRRRRPQNLRRRSPQIQPRVLLRGEGGGGGVVGCSLVSLPGRPPRRFAALDRQVLPGDDPARFRVGEGQRRTRGGARGGDRTRPRRRASSGAARRGGGGRRAATRPSKARVDASPGRARRFCF